MGNTTCKPCANAPASVAEEFDGCCIAEDRYSKPLGWQSRKPRGLAVDTSFELFEYQDYIDETNEYINEHRN